MAEHGFVARITHKDLVEIGPDALVSTERMLRRNYEQSGCGLPMVLIRADNADGSINIGWYATDDPDLLPGAGAFQVVESFA